MDNRIVAIVFTRGNTDHDTSQIDTPTSTEHFKVYLQIPYTCCGGSSLLMLNGQGFYARTSILPITLRVLIQHLDGAVLLIDIDAGKVQAGKPDADNCTVGVQDVESVGIVPILAVDV